MSVSPGQENEIISRWTSGQGIRSISRDMSLGRYVIARVIAEHQARTSSRRRSLDLSQSLVRRSFIHSSISCANCLNVIPVLLRCAPSKSCAAWAMARAIQYHAYGYQSLERILAHFGTPKANWELLSQRDQEALQQLTESTRVKIRRSEEYQQMFDQQSQVQGDEFQDHESQNNKQNQEPSRGDSPVSGDPEAENDRGTA